MPGCTTRSRRRDAPSCSRTAAPDPDLLAAGLASLAGGVCALAAFLTALVREEPVPPLAGGGGGIPVPEGGAPVELLIAGIALMVIGGGALVAYAYVRWRKRRAATQSPDPAGGGEAT
ncbi:hypothetical protein [Methanoculleus chikugoensis]|uniref:hypothetical protein n=1 Tax=Methanoculleus chikugoensis TaxID=118126 RepID=UPI000AC1C675|nr:hypothetical protein [Methanoculleus chikugoensis]